MGGCKLRDHVAALLIAKRCSATGLEVSSFLTEFITGVGALHQPRS
jgi:hypothetical protein